MRIDVDLSPLQITLVYVVFAMFALLVSDVLLVIWIDDPVLQSQLQTMKAGLEIALTAVLIYLLTRLSQQSLDRTNTQLERRTQELHILQRLFRHNIRNDINIIRGRAEWALDTADDAEVTDQLESVVTASNRIVTYVEKSKRISDLPDEESPLETQDMVDIVDDALTQQTVSITTVDIETETPSSAPVDAHRLLEFGVFEVIDNAIRHNESEDPELTITVEEMSNWVVLRVADNGPGIPKHERTVLREGGETPLVHSSGIGLWLAYWVTTRFNGDFEITENEPCGSVVTMRLPRA